MGLNTGKGYRTLLYVNTFAIVALGAVVAGWAVFLLFPVQLGQDYHSSLAAVQAIRKALFWKVAGIYMIISLLIFLSMVVLHLLYSHRIAGPTYRIGCEAAKIAQGNLTCNITLRRKDNLTDVKDFMNEVGCRYRARMAAIKDNLAAVEAKSEILSALVQQRNGGDALGPVMEELMRAVTEIERALAEIKT